jgi:hypothetical protein
MSTKDEDGMPLPRFWDIVERCRSDDEEERHENYERELSRLPPDQILAFDVRVAHLLAESYRTNLWAAAYCLCGGCSDDGFDYFRCWLIAQGKEIYEAALANPESLADIEGEDDFFEFESLYVVAGNAWQEVTGKSERAWYKAREAIENPPIMEREDEEHWDFEDEDEIAGGFRGWPRLFEDIEDLEVEKGS